MNLYAYCNNYSVNWIDPSGYRPKLPWLRRWLGEAQERRLESRWKLWHDEATSEEVEAADRDFRKKIGIISLGTGMLGTFVDLLRRVNILPTVTLPEVNLELIERGLEYSTDQGHRDFPGNTPDAPAPPTDDAGVKKALIQDPNDKLGPAGYGALGFVKSNSLLAYTIRFENVPDATAPAHIVRVIDTLDNDLDLATFELTEITFADHLIIVPEGLNHYETRINVTIDNEFISQAELVVDIDVSLDISTRELNLYYDRARSKYRLATRGHNAWNTLSQ